MSSEHGPSAEWPKGCQGKVRRLVAEMFVPVHKPLHGYQSLVVVLGCFIRIYRLRCLVVDWEPKVVVEQRG